MSGNNSWRLQSYQRAKKCLNSLDFLNLLCFINLTKHCLRDWGSIYVFLSTTTQFTNGSESASNCTLFLYYVHSDTFLQTKWRKGAFWPSEAHNRGECPGLSSKKHLLELSLSLDLMLVHSGNHLHCINVGGERWSGAKHRLFEQKRMMALMLESTPIELWSKSFTATPFLTCPLEKN